MKINHFIYVVLVWCYSNSDLAFAQLLSVTPNNNASALVNEIIGNNVSVNNISINCNSQATGIFYSNNSNIGIGQGILLCTGEVQNAVGPNNATNAGTGFSTSPDFNDVNIQGVEPDAKYDGCVLEFDIKPMCTRLEIKYVFASEEYPEYAGSNVNDAFGFFISGPNPIGGNYSGYNIARLPNGTPISINTINNGTNNNGPCVNCSYYLKNTASSVQYDGFTVPLTASVNVVPCNTYHLKLAIADAGDAIYDSGVFLQYKGIGCAQSTIPSITSYSTASNCDLNNGTASVSVSNYTQAVSYQWNPGGQTTPAISNLASGNYTCTLDFQYPCPFTKQVVVNIPHKPGFTFSNAVTNIKCPSDSNGSATVTVVNGNSPYTYNWNTIPPQFTNIASNLSLGQYVCTIQDANGCIKKDTINLFASTTLSLNPIVSSPYCGKPTGSITANATGGVPAYSYSYTTSPPQYTDIAINLLPGNYSVTVKDQDGCVFTKEVVVNNNTPAIILSDSLINATCEHANGAIYITSVFGGNAPYTYTWTTTPTSYLQNVTNLTAGTYSVNIKDTDNCPAQGVFVINDLSRLPVTISKKNELCRQNNGSITITVLGGTPTYDYIWSNGQTSLNATGLKEGVHSYTVTDALGCFTIDTISITNTDDVFNGYAYTTPAEPEANKPFEITLDPTSSWNLNLAVTDDQKRYYEITNTLYYENYGNHTMYYYVTSSNGCNYMLTYDFFVKDVMTIYVPNTFTPNYDDKNDGFSAKGTLVREFNMSIYDRWGELIFKSDDIDLLWDGTYKGNPCQTGTYTYKIVAKDYFNESKKFVGHVNLIR